MPFPGEIGIDSGEREARSEGQALAVSRNSCSDIREIPPRVLGGSRPGVSAMDALKNQASTATPADPPGLPW